MARAVGRGGATAAPGPTPTDDCDSQAAGRGHARYYTFILTQESEATITLESEDADTYLYLREGDARSGDYLHQNDDDGGTTRSTIQETLAAGTYTIEATTYSEGETGSFTLTLSGLGLTSATPPGSDREALVSLHSATDGENWANNANWLTEAPLAEWYGVTTDSGGRVTELSLSENRLTGEIPAALGSLSNLQELDLWNDYTCSEDANQPVSCQPDSPSANQLTGEIPEELGQLSNLTGLYLGGNRLTGEIPEVLGSLANLEALNLGANRLTGEIPAWLGGLANLENLGLNANQLNGRIPPALGGLSNLEILGLFGNRLSGEIPVELGNLANLESLYLDDNRLSGEIPAELGNLANLQQLWLSGNQLTGCVPDGLQYVPDNDFDELDLPFCTGSLPSPANARYLWEGSAIVVSWDAVAGADYYNIYYDDFFSSGCRLSSGSPSFCEELATNVVGTSYTHTDPDPDRNYYWITACNSAGCSEIDSNSPAQFIDNRPEGPSNARYHWEGSTIVVSWDAVAGADYYNIYYDDFFGSSCRLSSGSPSFCEELATNVVGTSYTHTDPDPDRNYYWITACNSAGCSEIDSANPASLEGATPAPDLVVDTPAVSDSAPDAGERITLSVTVRNQGNGSSDSTTLKYYRSTDSDISSLDTSVGTDFVSRLDPSESGGESISLTVPDSAGTYYYGACVDAVSDESDTTNNCSTAVAVSVGAAPAPAGNPDLVVESPSVSDSSPDAQTTFTLSVTVRNQGDGPSASTTLRYYRSTNASITTIDTVVGTDQVEELDASGTSGEAINLVAPSSGGTYYYGACVESVSGESNTRNNCSSGVRVTFTATEAVTGSISSCEVVEHVFGDLYEVSMTGSVSASREVTAVIVEGYVGGEFLGIDLIGDMAAGESTTFSISGFVSVAALPVRCTASAEWVEVN